MDKYSSLACGHYQGQIATSLKLTRPKRVVIATSNISFNVSSSRIDFMYENAVVTNAVGNMDNVDQYYAMTQKKSSRAEREEMVKSRPTNGPVAQLLLRRRVRHCELGGGTFRRGKKTQVYSNALFYYSISVTATMRITHFTHI